MKKLNAANAVLFESAPPQAVKLARFLQRVCTAHGMARTDMAKVETNTHLLVLDAEEDAATA